MCSYTCLQRTLGTAVAEDRLLPFTFVHLETAITSAQLSALEAEQPELPWSPPKPGLPALWLCVPPKLPWALSLLSPEAGSRDWMECPHRGLTM